MAGPEPYPQYKATDQELQRHAESRKASRAQARSSPSGKKRYVRTEAGARRYRKPVGAELGSARDASGAQAQKDTESTDRYSALVGGDRKAQADAMRGLNDDQLQRLSRVAYSFRSANPDVVRLRVGVAAELARRGFNVRDFGALGGGGSSSRGPGPDRSSAKARDRAKDRKKATGRVTKNDTQKAMAAMYGPKRKVSLSTPEQLRAALSVFSRVAPDAREKVARLLVRRAVELSATNFLGRSVIEAANLPDEEFQQVVELAGKWRHGYIPLDAAALNDKMRGKTGGKKWWSGGESGNAVGVPKKGDGGFRGRKVKDGKVLNNRATGNRFKAQERKPDFAAKRAAGRETAKKTPVTETLRSKTDRKAVASRANLIEGLSTKESAEYHALAGRSKYDTGKRDRYATARREGKTHSEAMVAANRTTVVKSGSANEGASMNDTISSKSPAGSELTNSAKAKNYVEMHSVTGARKKIEQIKRRNGGKETPMTRALATAIEAERERLYQANKARTRGGPGKA